LSRRGDAVEQAAETRLIELAYERDLPLVATNPAAYTDPSFHAAHDAMLCIANSAYLESNERVTSSPEAWLKDGAAKAQRRAITDVLAIASGKSANNSRMSCAGFIQSSGEER
jgi:DNA polymerase-3 subunit alpha